ncbi:MAG: peptide chain release factor N(5)-glutamine methyltransferase, partial [Saprospiraceae bacterium]|nr:peptide chain release factor N(5)-glutamine methyltransferase [Saprospiraceae bacterium]
MKNGIHISQAFSQITDRLHLKTGNPRTIARMLFEDLFAISNPDRDGFLTRDEWSLLQLATQRINQGEPLQYVTGISHFYGFVFSVDHRVLIPRSETEELVHLVLEQMPVAFERDLKVLDIGTGSGCIAISLKKKRPYLQVTALDLSADALEVAAQNSEKNSVEVTYICDDITDLHDPALMEGKWDVIVSNPPYIQAAEVDIMDTNVLQYEPGNALFPADNNP